MLTGGLLTGALGRNLAGWSLPGGRRHLPLGRHLPFSLVRLCGGRRHLPLGRHLGCCLIRLPHVRGLLHGHLLHGRHLHWRLLTHA